MCITKWLQELLDDVVLLWRNPTLNCDTIDPFVEVLVKDWGLCVIDLQIVMLRNAVDRIFRPDAPPSARPADIAEVKYVSKLLVHADIIPSA